MCNSENISDGLKDRPLCFNDSSALLEKMKKAKSLCDGEELKFSIALSDYLVSLYDNPSPDISIDDFIPAEKAERIRGMIEDMRTSVSRHEACSKITGAYIQANDRLENYPSLLIRLLEYFCAQHRKTAEATPEECYRFFKAHGCYDALHTPVKIAETFDIFEGLCRTYNENNYQYQTDDEIKEFLLTALDAEDKEKPINVQFNEEMEKLIMREAKAYKSFYDTLAALAETREEYKPSKDKNGNPDLTKLYTDAGLSKECCKAHRTKNFNEVKREAVIALILTLKLNIQEAETLMKSAGFQFNGSIVERFVKIMIVTKNWSRKLYRDIDRYYNLFYTHVNHNSPYEILNTVAKKRYKTQYARTFYIKSLFNLGETDRRVIDLKKLLDSMSKDDSRFKEISRMYKDAKEERKQLDNLLAKFNTGEGRAAFTELKERCAELNNLEIKKLSDEAFKILLLKKILHLDNSEEIGGQTVENNILYMEEPSDAKRAELKKFIDAKINGYIFNEHKLGHITKNDIAILKETLSDGVYLDLTDLLSEAQLDKLKETVKENVQRQTLYDLIIQEIAKNKGNENYSIIFSIISKITPFKTPCGQSTVNSLKNNKIKLPIVLPTEYLNLLQNNDEITNGLISCLQGGGSLLPELKKNGGLRQQYQKLLIKTLCSDPRQNFAENYRFDMDAFVSHLKSVSPDTLAETVIETFGLIKLLFGDGCKDFHTTLQRLAVRNKFKDKNAIEYLYEEAFGDNYRETLERHERCSFGGMTKTEEKAFENDLKKLKEKLGEDILIINYK